MSQRIFLRKHYCLLDVIYIIPIISCCFPDHAFRGATIIVTISSGKCHHFSWKNKFHFFELDKIVIN